MRYNQNIDYSLLLKDMMRKGARAEDVQRELDNRIEKANATPNLNQFAYDKTYHDALDYIRGEQRRQAAIDARDAATNQAIGRLDAQLPGINQTYDRLLRENEINNAIEQENIRRGSIFGNYSSTGLPDTLKTAQSTAYQNLRNKTQLDRMNAIRAIEQQKNDVRLTGDIKKADALAQQYAEMSERAYKQQLLDQQRAWDIEDRNFAADQRQNSVNQKAALELIMQGRYSPQLAQQAGLDPVIAQQTAQQAHISRRPARMPEEPKPAFKVEAAQKILDGGNFNNQSALDAYEAQTGRSYFEDNMSQKAIHVMGLIDKALDNKGRPQSAAWKRKAIKDYTDNEYITPEEAKMITFLVFD